MVQEINNQTNTNMHLFDPRGRLTPSNGERVYSTSERGYFSLDQPEINCAAIHARVAEFLNQPKLDQSITVDNFKARCDSLRSRIMADEATSNLFKGTHVPFLMTPPKGESDLGKELDSVLLESVARSFTARFPQFEFRNHEHGHMEGKISVTPGVRYENLLEARGRGPVVGWYFPNCMAGFAVPDQRALIGRLPPPLILSGPVEAAFAFVGVPELLMKNENYPNLLALAAVKPSKVHCFYFFEAYGWNLTFNLRSMVGAVSEYYAGGLTVIG